MNVGPIEGFFMVMAIVGGTLLYAGTPIILPVSFLIWKRDTLKNPRVFGPIAIVLCLLTRFLVYRVGAFLGSVGRMWVVESFIMVVILFWLERMFRAPTDGSVLIGR